MRVELPERVPALGGVIGAEAAIERALEDEIAACGEHAAIPGVGVVDNPARFLGHRIPRDELAFRSRASRNARSDLGRESSVSEVRAGVPCARAITEVLHVRIDCRQRVRRDVDKARVGAERHRVPVVRTERTRDLQRRLSRFITRIRRLDRTAGLEIDMRRPVDVVLIFVGRDQLARLAVDDIEEAVLRRLHDDLAVLAVDLQLGKHQRLRGGVVPCLAGSRLVVPDIFAGLGLDREDGRQEQVVLGRGVAQALVPGRAVADADIHDVEIGIVRHAIPGCAAAAALGPFAGVAPRGVGLLGEHFVRGCAIGDLGRVRRREEAPDLLAVIRAVGGDVAAHAKLGAAIADDHIALDDTRRAGDRIGLGLVDRDLLPLLRARLRVERDETAINRADEYFALPDRNAAVHDIAAGGNTARLVDFRIELPEALASLGVVSVDHRPGGGDVHHAVDHDRRRFHAAIGVELRRPGEAEVFHVRRRDQFQRRVTLLRIGAAMADPDIRPAVSRDDRCAIDIGGRDRLQWCIRLAACGKSQQRNAAQQGAKPFHANLPDPLSLGRPVIGRPDFSALLRRFAKPSAMPDSRCRTCDGR